jgi:hypothetical protein
MYIYTFPAVTGSRHFAGVLNIYCIYLRILIIHKPYICICLYTHFPLSQVADTSQACGELSIASVMGEGGGTEGEAEGGGKVQGGGDPSSLSMVEDRLLALTLALVRCLCVCVCCVCVCVSLCVCIIYLI